MCLLPVLHSKRSHRNEKPTHRSREEPPLSATREKHTHQQTPRATTTTKSNPEVAFGQWNAAAAAAAKSLQSCPTLCNPIDSRPPGSPSLGFSRQEHWSVLPFPSPIPESEVAQSCLTLSNPMDCSLPGSSIHGVFQARVLDWGAIAFSGFWMTRGQIRRSVSHQYTYTQVLKLCFPLDAA